MVFKVFMMLVAIGASQQIWAHAGEERARQAEAFQACVEDCVTYEQPGYELKACIEECKATYGIEFIDAVPQYCNTDEEDCEREGNEEI